MTKREEFTQLFVAVERDLMRYILTMIPRQADARDVLQETAVVLWNKFDQYDRNLPFGPWARKFSHVQVLKYRLYQHRRGRVVTALSDDALAALAAEYECHHDVLGLRISALAGCIDKLPSDDQVLLRRRYWTSAKPADLETTDVLRQRLYRKLYNVRRRLQGCIDRALAEQGA